MSRAGGPFWLLVGLAAALLVVVALVIGELFVGFEFSDRYSVLRGGADGSKALWLTLERLGYPLRRLHELPASAGHEGVLFLLLDAEGARAFPPADDRELLGWVADGNTLVVAHAGRMTLAATLGVSTSWESDGEASNTRHRMGAGDGIGRLAAVELATFCAPGSYRLERGNAAVLLEGVSGPVAVVIPQGLGRVVLLSDPWPLSNLGLAEPGNLELALFLADLGRGPEGVVAFDELHHGFAANRSIIGWLRRRGFTAVLLQALFVLVIVVFALRGRRGRSELRRAEPAAPGSAEHLAGMARLYASSGFAAEAAADLAADLERSILRASASSARARGSASLVGGDGVATLARIDPALARAVGGARASGLRADHRYRDVELVAFHNEVIGLRRRVLAALGAARERV